MGFFLVKLEKFGVKKDVQELRKPYYLRGLCTQVYQADDLKS